MTAAPMGWNSYDYYDTTVTEADVKRNADFMAAHLMPFGWKYVVIDIEWYAPGAGSRRSEYQYIPFSDLYMDAYARLLPDPERFPSSRGGAGFKPLADYIHGKGLLFGIHIMRGIPRQAAHAHAAVLGADADAAEIADPSSICRWNPHMYGVKNTPAGQKYYDSIAALYASWGVDFIKCDDMSYSDALPGRPGPVKHEIEMLSSALKKCGREIVLSLSPGPALIEEAAFYERNAAMWRITGDFWDEWPLLKDMFGRCALWQRHVSRGSYPDADMLPLGKIGRGFGEERKTRFTETEQYTLMNLWCIFGAPLMLGADMPQLDPFTCGLLTNPGVLAMRDDALLPREVMRTEEMAVWEKRTWEGELRYFAIFNLADEAQTITYRPEVSDGCEVRFKELWQGAAVEMADGAVCVTLPAHGSFAAGRA